MSDLGLFFDRERVANVAALVARFPAKELCSPTRSNLPLLALLRDHPAELEAILALTGLTGAHSSHLEYTVDPARGKGGASCTDLMLRGEGWTMAIEAKWTEPRYETVAKWIARGRKPENRRLVLGGWIDLLQPHAARTLQPGDFDGCVYQLVHRAASACWESAAPHLAYLTFQLGGVATARHYCEADLEDLWDRLGRPKRFRFYHHQLALQPTSAFGKIANLPKRHSATAGHLRTALAGYPLFAFVRMNHRRIGDAA